MPPIEKQTEQFRTANDCNGELSAIFSICLQIGEMFELQSSSRLTREISKANLLFVDVGDFMVKDLANQIQRARQIGMSHDQICACEALLHHLKGEEDEVIRWCSEALTLNSPHVQTAQTVLLLLLGAYLHMGRAGEIRTLDAQVTKFCDFAQPKYAFPVLLSWQVARGLTGDDVSREFDHMFAIARQAMDLEQIGAERAFLKIYLAYRQFVQKEQFCAAGSLLRFAAEVSARTKNDERTIRSLMLSAEMAEHCQGGDFVRAESILQEADLKVAAFGAKDPKMLMFVARINLNLARVILERAEQNADDSDAYSNKVRRALHHLETARQIVKTGPLDQLKPSERGELYLRLATIWLFFDKVDLALEFVKEASVPGTEQTNLEVQRLLLEAMILQASGATEQVSKNITEIQTRHKDVDIDPSFLKQVELLQHSHELFYRPFCEWLHSAESEDIRKKALDKSVQSAIAEEVKPLIRIWNTFRGVDDRLIADALDFWGRGGFARVTAAIRGSPFGVATVNAHSVLQIRELCQILLPLFDVVVVLWHGPLSTRNAVVPLVLAEGNEKRIGGHFYQFQYMDLGGGFRLIASGRASVIPDDLVYCNQNSLQ